MSLRIYDNGGETLDRYSIVIGTSVYTMSHCPSHPQGVNAYMCELDKLEKGVPSGQQVSYDSLPEEVRKAIADRVFAEIEEL